MATTSYTPPMRILLVEDQLSLRGAISRRLATLGGVDEATDGAAASAYLRRHTYDVVVLDRGLPDGDGLNHLKAWRREGYPVPVLVLTARDGVHDRVEGLEAGADDYLIKPFALDELVARLRALTRRSALPQPTLFHVRGVEVDQARGTVRRDGVLLPLKPKELAVLTSLCQHQGRVLSKDQLGQRCWPQHAEPQANVVEVVVAAVRRKLGDPQVIHTVRGLGYRVDVDAT
jgi:DNA-binding response OmpR family regulator